MNNIRLTKLKAKQSAIVKEIVGGEDVTHRLATLGIRPGKRVTLISSHFWRGPVTVLADKTKIAIGHGMANRIIVEVE